MISIEATNIVRSEMNKIIEFLHENHGIDIQEVKVISYGIKYEVKKVDFDTKGILVVYHGKKGFKFVDEKVGCEEAHENIKRIFNLRENLQEINIVKSVEHKGEEKKRDKENIFKNIKNEESNINERSEEESDVEKTYLDKLFERLKPYAEEEFDFTIIAEELMKCSREEHKAAIKENIYNFYGLERIYLSMRKKLQ